ncbi:Cytochrome [Forsythia ovata]|uniref:Flavonoid-6-hydroxylase n=1 Tax=Forsythia ovata TaxID=205694 RepID=A0ABD1T5T4_9LAMI
MDFLSHDLQLAAVSGLLALLMLYYLWSRKSKVNGISPPEPVGAWPVIGHLHLLGGPTTVSRVLAALADKYGPIFKIRLGMHPAVVVSNWEAVKECFTTNDKALCKRPNSSVGKYLGYNNAGFGFTHGSYWREVRKLVLLEVLSSRRLEALKHVRITEIETSIKELYQKIDRDRRLVNSNENSEFDRSSKEVVISQWIEHLSLNIIVKMIAGKRYTETEEARSFRKVIKEFMYVSGQFVLSDAIPLPFLKWIDFQGHIKFMKRISKELSVITESWIDEHIKRNLKGELGYEQDFIDVMLSAIDEKFTNYGHSRETIIKATILNIILAGSDTTSVHLTWILSLLVNNREVMKRAQEEIDIKVGKERWVDESDIKNLVYLQAIVKETLRLFPPGPLSVPHEAMEDCHVGGYFIPKGTRLLVNVWKLHRDPRVWSEPDEFIPERFLTSHAEVDYLGQHFEFTPFGSGRRACPGITFAMQVTHLTLARLLQGFDFTTPLNMPVDMTEGQSITLPKAKPLQLLVTARLSSGFYEN